MTDLIKHRGPDDEGFLLFSKRLDRIIPFGGQDTPDDVYRSSLSYTPKVSDISQLNIAPHEISVLLGHRRLSIVDLSHAGHQPMNLNNKSIWITYNGEIYNYIEIRQELVQAGYSFHSQSDTEVVLKAYQHWGSDCLQKFNGMFAFILIDIERNTLFIARDRFGEKPLYFWESPAGFLAFASEIKQFTCLPGWLAKANKSRALDYLSRGLTDHTRMSLFDNVSQIRGGEYIECPLDIDCIPSIKTWYGLKKTPVTLSFHDAATHLHFLLEDSVRLRLRADTAIGSCLSGGLDSSAIVCIVNNLLKSPSQTHGNQKTFSAKSHVARFDESHYIHEVSKHTQVTSHYITPSVDDLFPSLKKIVWHQDEPFGSTSIFAQYLVFAEAHKTHVKVMLDGQGADENLGGYSSFWPAHFAQLIKNFQWWSLHHEIHAFRKTNRPPHLSLSGLINQLLPRRHISSIKNLLSKQLSKNSLDIYLNFNQHDYTPYTSPSHDNNINHLVDKLAFDQITNTSLPALLHYEDRNSMAHSIEARTPFLDFRLVEFIFNLPAHFKISQGFTKRILREALKGVLPEIIRLRTDKLGFATAEETWMCDERSDLFRNELLSAIEKCHELINSNAIHMANDILNKKIPFNWSLWRIINFGYWIETFNVTF